MSNRKFMSDSIAKIIFDCERMKYPNTGLFHFCKNLGRALLQRASVEKESISIYVQKKYRDQFGAGTDFIDQSPIHKFFLPGLKGYDIWHATHQSTNYFPFQKKIKILLTIHDINFMHEQNRSEKKKQRELAKLQKKIDRADRVVAISNFVAADVQKYLQIDPHKLSVIYNGCNIDHSIEPHHPKNIPASPFLFTIGTIVEKKNFHVLPALLVNNNFQLLIAGVTNSNAYREKIIEEAAKWKVLDRVVFLDAIAEREKYWYYQNCKAFVFPSLMEGFGLPVVEAMAYGKPVFISRLTSLPEIAGDAAIYFDSFDPEHMQTVFTSGLKAFEADRGRPVMVRERANEFSWNKTADEYLGVYRKLMNH